VIIQFSAILAVIANYKDKFTFKHHQLWLKVSLAFIPIGVVGLLFHKQIKEFFTVPVVGTMFIVGGVVFLILEYFHKEHHERVDEVESISYKQALWVGIAQVFALIPGTSRAGASIVGGLLVGLNRKASAEFSFLLALPVLAAAAGFDMLQNYKELLDGNLLVLAVGFVTSFLVSYLTIKLFVRFLDKFTFVGFGIYRILFGIILLWIL
jgi:undecaprenyl-diphosphatase